MGVVQRVSALYIVIMRMIIMAGMIALYIKLVIKSVKNEQQMDLLL